MENQYNMRSPAVKRLMKEAQELRQPSEEYYAQPLEDNLFEWHFTVRGPSDSDFDNGIYHGRIILPPEYPMKPPSIILLTPNGRFEVNKKICLSISGYHPESWQPSWSIRTALLAMIGFMPTFGNGAIGSLDYTSEERKTLAKMSHSWKCSVCGSVNNLLLKRTKNNPTKNDSNIKLNLTNDFEAPNGHVLSSELPVSPNTELPFSNTIPIPLPDSTTADIPQFPMGVQLQEPTPYHGSVDGAEKTESTNVEASSLRKRKTTIETPQTSAASVVSPDDNYFFFILKCLLVVGIVLLALRRIFFL